MIKLIVKNRYLLVTILFVAWMLFFDDNNLIQQYRLQQQYNKLIEEKEYYIEQIAQARQDREELFTNEETLEKFAREKYMMKKDNEEVFVIVEEEN